MGTKSSNYTLVVNAATGAPVSLTFVGYDRLFGSHYDKYVITYSDFSTDPPEPSTFDVPNGKTALNGLFIYIQCMADVCSSANNVGNKVLYA